MTNGMQLRIIGLMLVCGLIIKGVAEPTSRTRDDTYTIDDIIAFYNYDQSQPLDPDVQLIEETFFHKKYHVTYNSIHGERVPAILIIPQAYLQWPPWAPWPCILFLHGYGWTKEVDGWLADILLFIELSSEERYAIMSIDAEYHGERSEPGRDIFGLNFLQDRNALAQTVIDNRRAIDYLQTRSDIDPNQIHAMGVSMGAILGGLLASIDNRVQAVSLIVGGGDWTLLVSESDIPPAIPMREALNNHYEMVPKWFDPVDPINTVQLISPRALQMHNGIYDITVPTGQQLFDAALEPKEIYWYPGNHYTVIIWSLDIINRSLVWFNQWP